MYAVEIFHNEISKARDLIEVAMFLPDKFIGCEHSFSHFASVAGSLKLGQTIHDLLVILRLDWSAIFTLATFIICDDCRKSENETFRKFSLSFEICLHPGEVACLVFRE